MPLSSMAQVLKPYAFAANDYDAAVNRDPELGYAAYAPGASVFQFNYGTRLILNAYGTNPLPEHMPGILEIVERYNSSAQQPNRVDPKAWLSMATNVVRLLRFVSNVRTYNATLGADRRIFDEGAVDRAMMPAQAAATLTDVIGMTTSTDRVGVASTIANSIGDSYDNSVTGEGTYSTSRRSAAVYNIIDLGVNPVNVHAMRKEIPLANLKNFAYTCDANLADIIGSTYDESNLNGNGLSTRDVLAALLKYPYVQVPKTVYYDQLYQIVSGVTRAADFAGRPKFIADQLWSKVLFNQVTRPGAPPSRTTNRRRVDRDEVGQPLVAATPLTFLRGQRAARTAEVEANVGGAGNTTYLRELGRLRFDTKLMRNLFFITQIQRLMTHKIGQELNEIHSPIVSREAISNRKVTDYQGLETQTAVDID
jgi:hypothetical protein